MQVLLTEREKKGLIKKINNNTKVKEKERKK